MTTTHTWVIGAAPHCDIVVDAPTVSGTHCRLTRRDGDYSLEDLGSTNGTFVNGTRIGAQVAVTRSDQVFLGARVPLPWPVLPDSPSPASASSARQTVELAIDAAMPTELRLSRPLMACIAAVSVLVAVVVLAAMLRPRSSREPIDEIEAATVSEVATAASAPVATTSHVAGASSQQPSPQAVSVVAAQPHETRDALYAVILADEQESERYRLGTACAVGPRRLLTCASIVAAADQLADRFPKLLVVSANNDGPYQVRLRKRHPNYDAALAKANELRRLFAPPADLDETQPTDTPVPSEQELAAFREQAARLVEQMLASDLAMLEVDRPLPYALDVDSQPPTASEPLQLIGLPHDNDVLFFSAETPLECVRVAAQLVDARTAAQPTTAGALLVRSASEQQKQSWTGSALVNERGNLVGLYTRLKALPDSDANQVADQFDVTLVGNSTDF